MVALAFCPSASTGPKLVEGLLFGGDKSDMVRVVEVVGLSQRRKIERRLPERAESYRFDPSP